MTARERYVEVLIDAGRLELAADVLKTLNSPRAQMEMGLAINRKEWRTAERSAGRCWRRRAATWPRPRGRTTASGSRSAWPSTKCCWRR